ncbi:head maturation protease, ClpP-related [Fusobacterium varium]|uniref:head maturation protease, ClpP-related n=1 Tax=Fusobacterium varium TaxID=856 RepID=UPI0022E8CDA9|nr:head maturation protease, ClpP-related [Fusobacterium varium]
MKTEKKFGALRALNRTDTSLDLCIYGDIVPTEDTKRTFEDVTPAQMKDFLEYAGNRELDIYINSVGGDAYAGFGIYNMLKAYPQKKRVHIEGVAGSISSVIAFAGDEIYMPTNSSLMIHTAWGIYAGNSQELQKVVEFLNRLDNMIADIYVSKVKANSITKEKIFEMMQAETWLSGTEAAKIFNIIEIDPLQVYAMIDDVNKFKNIPAEIKNVISAKNRADDEKIKLEKAKLNLLLITEG